MQKIEETNKEVFDRVAEEYENLKIIATAIIKAESQFENVCNKDVGCVGGIGIFQIVQSTFDEQCDGDVYDPEDNIRCGFKMLTQKEYWRWKQSSDVWLYSIPIEYAPAVSF